MLVPNDMYWQHYQSTGVVMLPTPDSIRSVGTEFVVGQVMESLGLSSMLNDALGATRAHQVATIVEYMVCRGNVMDHLTSWCHDHSWAKAPISAQQASRLFSSLTHREKMEFFRAWVAAQPTGSYLAYDVTSFSSYAEGITDLEWGYNRDGDRLPQINLGCYLNQDSGLPVFYLSYPGSIVDISHLRYMMAYNTDLGIKDVGFVMDKGFCSTANIDWMHNQKLDVILGAETRHQAIRNAIDQVKDQILSMRHLTPHGVYACAVRGRFYGVPSSVHIYYDPLLAERQRQDLFRSVDNVDNTLNQLSTLSQREATSYRAWFTINRAPDGSFTYSKDYDKIDAAAHKSGFFALLTTTDLDSTTVLTIYRRKDVIEKGFDDIKNQIDMKRLRTHNDATTDGKLFLAFIALIVTCHIQTRIGSLLKEKSWSKNTVINHLDKIRIVTTCDGGRLMNPITKAQRLILKHLSLTEEDIKDYILSNDPDSMYVSRTGGI
jgi:transposase